jgi:spore germination cell wall hydrolase CwlJ-like protein
MTAHRTLVIGQPAPRRKQWALSAVLALIALALLTAGLVANVNRRVEPRTVMRLPAAASPQQGSQNAVALPNLLKPLTPEQAVLQNAERPFDATPDTPAQKFKLTTDKESRDRAIDCLAQAVYYEAATEGTDGERAVAQVVLNRMRHPGFPSSVCGVVYQGSELPTGCQFTFTCDGSLARIPIPALWTQARKIAIDALDGHVFAAIGHATHYHADYVLPYWADSLAKQVQIGRHIFYRLKGGLGSSAAFSQRYAGSEPNLPPAQSTIEVAAQATDAAQALLNSGLTSPMVPVAADAAGVAAAPIPKDVLLADSSKGELLIDQGAAPTPLHKRRPTQDDCSAGGGAQMLPATPDDFHAGGSPTSC